MRKNKKKQQELPDDDSSEKTLLEKTGISYDEYLEIKFLYGVSASQILKSIIKGKYRFTYPDKAGLKYPPISE